ncbi:MAG: homoserine dehydrogenase [Chlamydiota bacterium]|nr:homoserine dehydrogenase [Chlamydiota bacterium]
MDVVKVGLIGCGTVGTGVVRLFQDNGDLIAQRTGTRIRLVKAADKDSDKLQGLALDASMLTQNAEEVLEDPQINIVIELIGGINPAKEFILKALKNGKHVVTANKALLAHHGKELFQEAQTNKKNLFFEASVGGGIPVIKGLREGLVGNHLRAIYGIVNGTANYILSKMELDGMDYKAALKQAKVQGYAEADPSLDVDGIDSAHKLVIMASLAYGHWISLDQVYVEGIGEITHRDIEYAQHFGYVIKLLAIAKEKDGKINVRVHPTFIPRHYLLSQVQGVYNAIYYVADFAGRGMFYGRGAGQNPTASAVVSDLVDIVHNIERRRLGFVLDEREQNPPEIVRIEDLECRNYIRVSAIDQPGVLARIAGILGDHGISISSVIQKERKKGAVVPVVMMTHVAKEKDFQEAIRELDTQSCVKSPTFRIRIEQEESEES